MDDGVCHLFYGAQALSWTVYQSDLSFAVDINTEDDEDFIVGNGKTHFLEYDWTGGVRGWFGWNWSHGWDLKLAYTYFADEAKHTVNTQGSDIDLYASLFHPDSPEELAEKASGKNKIEYQTLDVVLGKVMCFCSNQIMIHPFFGARGLKLDQDLKVLYEGEDFVVLPAQPFIGGVNARPGQVKWQSDVLAGGLIAGMDTQFRGIWGFGAYGSFATSILASRTDNKHKQRILDEEGEELTVQIDLEEQQWLSLPGFTVAAGISWDWCFCGCFYLKLKAGYEFNKWFNTQQIRKYMDDNEGVSCDNTSGDIGLHGGVFSVEIYF
jgi:hypothetical protein